ncbi:hypothetical protein DVH24_038767 [Malus domestica]|uniref:Uncharacterized protein n=1 Tax=Malus domestica TaxID=3750 RepID=A0A498KG89_MALDO|nr:hypothetical protein DVH24_038767 [Malus domestica]
MALRQSESGERYSLIGVSNSNVASKALWFGRQHTLFFLFFRKTNEKGLKTLSFNDKDKIKGKVNSTRIDFLV